MEKNRPKKISNVLSKMKLTAKTPGRAEFTRLIAFSQNLSMVMKNMQKRVRNLWITAKN